MVLCAFPGGSCFSMMHCGRMRVAMLLVRQVAPPEGALLCAVELLPDVPCGRMRVPMLLVRLVARPDAAGSAGCSSRRCLALRCGAASRWCCAPFLLAVASRWCHRLPRRISTHRLPRSGNLFRTDFRFASSLPQRFACGPFPFTRDMGVHGLCGRVPDSAGSIICHPAASPDQAAASSGPGAPDC